MKQAVSKKPRAEASQALCPKFQRILVAVDFSEESRSALACAAELAAKFDASLTLVHVVEPHFAKPEMEVLPAHAEVGSADEMAEAKLDLSALGEQMLGPCRLVETLVRSGLAFYEITEAAKMLGADLIVVGTHGDVEARRAVVGSTAEKVVRHAPCPVLVARATHSEYLI